VAATIRGIVGTPSDLQAGPVRSGQIIQPQLEQLSAPEATLDRDSAHEPVSEAGITSERIGRWKLEGHDQAAILLTAGTDQPLNVCNLLIGQWPDPPGTTALPGDCVESLIKASPPIADLVEGHYVRTTLAGWIDCPLQEIANHARMPGHRVTARDRCPVNIDNVTANPQECQQVLDLHPCDRLAILKNIVQIPLKRATGP
jgi:hypothetical protein